ncbi:sesquipedalian-1-like [Littorina saxatilis]|uniref:PH domain-containing protein n=1 Tax=Littorina saxatilis TaxID=31220 RepID=A0AAN9FVY7_9CAEN
MKIINAKGLARFAASGGHPEKEGMLLKRGELNKGFQRRWFVLRGNLLFYYEKKVDKEPSGVIILEGCTIEVADLEDTDNYAFQIAFPGGASRTYILSADSQEELEAWMRALSCAPYDYVKLIVAELQNQLEEVASRDNAKLVEAAERESRILGRTYSDEAAASKPRRPPRPSKDRVNPFNDFNDSSTDDFDAFRDRTSSASLSLNIATWQMLGISSFQEMHDEMGRQIKEYSTALKQDQRASAGAGVAS